VLQIIYDNVTACRGTGMLIEL